MLMLWSTFCISLKKLFYKKSFGRSIWHSSCGSVVSRSDAAAGNHDRQIREKREMLNFAKYLLFRTTSPVSVEIDALESLEPAGKRPLQSRKYHDIG